jgi:hypothetical protein
MGIQQHRKGYPHLWKGGDVDKSCTEIRTILRLPNSTFFDIEMTSKSLLDKAKPFVRIGRKGSAVVPRNDRSVAS